MCWDNAAAESFLGTLKTELVNRNNYRTRHHARLSSRYWIEAWYNPRRLHSTIGQQPPTNGRTTTTITRPHKPSVQHLGGTPVCTNLDNGGSVPSLLADAYAFAGAHHIEQDRQHWELAWALYTTVRVAIEELCDEHTDRLQDGSYRPPDFPPDF